MIGSRKAISLAIIFVVGLLVVVFGVSGGQGKLLIGHWDRPANDTRKEWPTSEDVHRVLNEAITKCREDKTDEKACGHFDKNMKPGGTEVRARYHIFRNKCERTYANKKLAEEFSNVQDRADFGMYFFQNNQMSDCNTACAPSAPCQTEDCRTHCAGKS